MTVREAMEEDLDGLLALYAHLHENPLPEKGGGLSALWQGILADPNHHIIVALASGQIVASCVLLVVPNLTHGQRPYALVENVVTAASHRRQGFASACLAHARRLAQRQNCYKIMLLTGSKSQGTLRFYEKAGYNSADKTAFIQWL